MSEAQGPSGAFFVVPMWLFAGRFRGLSDGARMLYGYLASCMLASRGVPAWSELAAIFGVSRRQIARRFAELEKAGLLRKVASSGGPRTCNYVLFNATPSPEP